MAGTQEAHQAFERRAVQKMIADLRWSGAVVVPGPNPPDAIVTREGGNVIAVEVTKAYPIPGKKGSELVAREKLASDRCAKLIDSYYAEPGATISVNILLPKVIDSSAVARVDLAQHGKDLDAIFSKALVLLHAMAGIAPYENREFEIPHRDGRHATFHVHGVPEELGPRYTRWQVTSNLAGWHDRITADRLQEIVAGKAGDLAAYRRRYARCELLVVANGETASGFLDLEDGARIDPMGFDAVYFQRYPFDGTQDVPLLP